MAAGVIPFFVKPEVRVEANQWQPGPEHPGWTTWNAIKDKIVSYTTGSSRGSDGDNSTATLGALAHGFLTTRFVRADKDGGWVSGAVLKDDGPWPLKSDGTWQKNWRDENVDRVEALLCFDLDALDQGSLDAILTSLETRGLAHSCYSTFSHSAAKMKARIVLYISTPIPAATPVELKAYAQAYHLIGDELVPGYDTSCANAARIIYLPSHNGTSPTFSRFMPGALLDPTPYVEKASAEVRTGAVESEERQRAADHSTGHGKVRQSDLKTPNLFRFNTTCRTMFEARDFVEAHDPDVRCPNHDGAVTGRAHTDPNGTPFHVVNASENRHGKGYALRCLTEGCTEWFGRDSLLFLDALCQAHGIKDATELLAWCVDPAEVRRAYDGWDVFQRPIGADGTAGSPYPNQHNVRVAMRKLGVAVSFDKFADVPLIEGFEEHGPRLEDPEMIALWLRIEEQFRLRLRKEKFYDIVLHEARQNTFHPVRRYLDDVQGKWDGVGRIDRWLETYLGAEDTTFNRATAALWLIAAVRRIRQPGCKFDELPIWESAQGKEKSTALSVLAVRPEWFSDTLCLNDDPKVVIEQTRGKWLVEVADMQGFKRADVDKLKASLSRQRDEARRVWGKLREDVPRAFVCCGTTNGERYLVDLTGNRRFWPVAVGTIDMEGLRRDRDQLWAEAATREAAGASIRLDRSLWGEAAKVQEARQVENPYLGILTEKMGVKTGKISREDILTLLDIKPERRYQSTLEQIKKAMETLGWKYQTVKIHKVPVRGFVKGDAEERKPTLGIRWNAPERRYDIVCGGEESDVEPGVSALEQLARERGR